MPDENGNGERVARIDDVIEECMRRREAGETWSDEEITAAHPDLMPELGEQLEMLAMVKRAGRQADETRSLRPTEVLQERDAEPSDVFPDFLPGYEILDEIQSGGQAVVYTAIQTATKRKVALKVLPQGPHASARARFYFEREVELAANLQHPNIVTVYEGDVVKGWRYFAMEYISGKSLDDYVRSRKLTVRQVMVLFRKICNAVTYAHQNGVIHRDLKPNNILVDDHDEPHVLDFGLAKAIHDEDRQAAREAAASMTGQIVGTLAYMSPEQAAGQSSAVGVLTDVYSLGVVLYQVLTGLFPYDVRGETLQVLRNIQEAEPIRPRKIDPHLDSDVEAILLKALTKEPSRRYQSAAELEYDVKCWLNGMPITARSASSIYVLRKLMVKHWYASTVVGLVVVIILGFGYVSFDFYRQAEKALAQKVRSDQASFKALQDLDDTAGEALRQRARALRENAMTWILHAWRQKRLSELEAIRKRFPPDCREQRAVSFLLDPRPLHRKVDEFRTALGDEELGFAEYIIAEHYLNDGNERDAIAAYRRCSRVDPGSLLATMARARLKSLSGTTKPVTPLTSRDGNP